jgi:hypothetical protein
MSQQQSQPAPISTAPLDEAIRRARSVPTPERQAELRAAYEANVAAGEPPYDRAEIRTPSEGTIQSQAG